MTKKGKHIRTSTWDFSHLFENTFSIVVELKNACLSTIEIIISIVYTTSIVVATGV